MNKIPATSAITVKSRTETLNEVREFISTAAQQFGFDEESVGKIALAVDEACTNIIKHAYHFSENQDILVKIIARNGAFEVVISDHGDSFDPDSVKLPEMKEYLERYKRGGLGMYLMKKLMDRVEYRVDPEKGNEVRLVKYLSSHV